VQPIIGYMSDKTWNRLGRRKPYFLVGAILASLALLVMPNSPVLWFAAGMLWIMDASINVTMEPMRAFVGDMLPDEQRTTGFAVQTFFIGASSVVGSLMPFLLTRWFHVANTAPQGQVPASVKWSFYLGGAVYPLAVLWTIFSVREYSPEEQESFHARAAGGGDAGDPEVTLDSKKYYGVGALLLLGGLAASFAIRHLAWDKALYILSFGASFYGVVQMVAAGRCAAGKKRASSSWSTTSTTCRAPCGSSRSRSSSPGSRCSPSSSTRPRRSRATTSGAATRGARPTTRAPTGWAS
jgi:maltose/moltooligosaccharide transporter